MDISHSAGMALCVERDEGTILHRYVSADNARKKHQLDEIYYISRMTFKGFPFFHGVQQPAATRGHSSARPCLHVPPPSGTKRFSRICEQRKSNFHTLRTEFKARGKCLFSAPPPAIEVFAAVTGTSQRRSGQEHPSVDASYNNMGVVLKKTEGSLKIETRRWLPATQMWRGRASERASERESLR